MDSNEAANLANIKTARLTVWLVGLTIVLVVLTVIAICLMAWPLLYPPNPSQPPLTGLGGALMVKGWTPIIVLASGLVLSAISLLIVASKRWKNKRLTAELDGLKVDLTKEKASSKTLEQTGERLEREKRELWEQNTKLTTDLASANSEKERPDQKRLQIIAKQDTEDIQDSVIVSGIQFRNEIEFGNRHIDLVFAIYNQSLYDITIDSQLGDGNIIFNKQPLVKKKEIVENKAQNLPARISGHFTVRQYLDSGDIEDIENATGDRHLDLHNLRIKIKAGAGFEQVVSEKRLKVEGYLTKDNPIWINYNGPFRNRFNSELVGRIREVFFQSQWDVGLFAPGQDNAYNLFFVIHAYLINHGAPTTIERFSLTVKVNGESYEAERQPLNGFRVARRGEPDDKPLDDIEELNGRNFSDTRRGWLRFRVSGIKRYDEDKPKLELELDAIDKNEDPNRLTTLPESKWLGHRSFQESRILGSDEWAESERKATS
jgi:hypothetical protein